MEAFHWNVWLTSGRLPTSSTRRENAFYVSLMGAPSRPSLICAYWESCATVLGVRMSWLLTVLRRPGKYGTAAGVSSPTRRLTWALVLLASTRRLAPVLFSELDAGCPLPIYVPHFGGSKTTGSGRSSTSSGSGTEGSPGWALCSGLLEGPHVFAFDTIRGACGIVQPAFSTDGRGILDAHRLRAVWQPLLRDGGHFAGGEQHKRLATMRTGEVRAGGIQARTTSGAARSSWRSFMVKAGAILSTIGICGGPRQELRPVGQR